MGRVLVVDDSAVDREIAAGHIREAGFEPIKTSGAEEAIELLAEEKIDIVLTDLIMPDMDGLDLVEQIMSRFRLTPIILMTSKGSEEVAVAALKAGAASYIPKRLLKRELKQILEDVYKLAQTQRRRHGVIESIVDQTTNFRIGYEQEAPVALLSYLADSLQALKLCDERGQLRIGTALTEALRNAIDHGNLELDSALRESGDRSYWELGEQRKTQSPYKNRRVTITATFSESEARFVIRDEGPGYNVAAVPDPTRPENVLKASGRGLVLMRTFMHEVTTNDRGNELTMIYRKASVTDEIDTTAYDSDSVADGLLFDRQVALENLAGSEALLAETAQLFPGECQQLLSQLDHATEVGDLTTISRAAHTIKSSAKLLGAYDAAESAKSVEELARNGNLAAARKARVQLKVDVNALSAQLDREFGPN